eukprot:TRINITY_DN2069_c0_g1_i3.p1 TRINITY_DN2069_c0_g1~~TRINITY_DN2069_c0_g1_i3.p1  ORF type:complete len:170 (+),score=2.95 TRINITY_DN2069_c0_g1_i3:444-953(+)
MSTGGTKKQGHHFKLVLLGNSAAGKTSICNRFVNDAYTEHAESTIGASFMQKSIVMEDNEQIHFDIWDTAGQERFKSLAPMYYRGSAAAIIVYDITDNVRERREFTPRVIVLPATVSAPHFFFLSNQTSLLLTFFCCLWTTRGFITHCTIVVEFVRGSRQLGGRIAEAC